MRKLRWAEICVGSLWMFPQLIVCNGLPPRSVNTVHRTSAVVARQAISTDIRKLTGSSPALNGMET